MGKQKKSQNSSQDTSISKKVLVPLLILNFHFLIFKFKKSVYIKNSFKKKSKVSKITVMEEFKRVADHFQAIKTDRKNLNSLLSLVEVFENVNFFKKN